MIRWICCLFLFYGTSHAQMIMHGDTHQTKIQSTTPKSRVVWHMPRQYQHVALTFDDGPDDQVTPLILDALHKKNVRATFFLVGHMISKFPHITQRIIKEGHDIANHTWAHYRLDEMTQSQVALQISTTTEAIHQLNVPMAPYVRPPGGRFNNFLLHAAKRQQLTIVMWDVNAADYKSAKGVLPPPQQIQSRVLRHVKPGSIVLMHNSMATVQALPGIIDAIKEKGLQLGLLQW